MRKERILAVIMSVLLALSMIPATVFAAELSTLDGKVKIQGTVAEGRTLSAEFKEVKPEGLTEDDVTYLWERKTTEDEEAEKAGEKPELKELGKDKTYVVTQDDIGTKIVLTITGKEENGYTGSLKVVSDTVIDAQTAADMEAKAAEEKMAAADNTDAAEQQDAEESAEASEQQNTDEAQSQDTEASSDTEETTQTDMTENTDESYQEDPSQAGNESVEGIPAATTDEEKQQDESAGTESVDGIPEATEDGTYGQTTDTINNTDSGENNESGDSAEEAAPAAGILVGDGSSEVVDFGTVISGQEDNVQAQYVTVTNTGNTTLNFAEISPEHFMVQDISDPMEQNSSQQLWIVPRAGVEAGSYDDIITYTSEEGVEVSFEAKMTVEAAKDDVQDENGQDDQKTDTDNTSDPTAGDQNKGDETPADSTTDPSNDANTSDDGNNGSTTTEVTLAVDDTVAESGLTFKSTESQQIAVKNNSEQAVTVTAASTGADPAVTIDPSEQEIPAGDSATFTVTPAENLATDTPYPDNILFADKNNSDNKIIVPVNVTIPAPAVSNVTTDKTGAEFGTLVEGYTELPDAKTITLTNEGNADADLSEAVSGTGTAQGQYFDITWQKTVVKSGEKAVFTVQPKTGLTANATPYTETFTITDNTTGKSIPITATVTVNPASHSLDTSQTNLDFATAKKGYGEVTAQQFTVTNNGNVTETLEQPALTNFTVSVDPSQLTLAPGTTAVYTVQPKTGLDVGAYSETIKISSDKSVTVNFQVVKGNAVLTKIQQPAAVTGLANGTKKAASSLKLPSTVVIETTEGSMKAAVSWNVKEASYKQSSTDAQKFTVSGTVTLPSGVDNDNKISLATSVEVSVNAYSAKVASAENNKITGIDVNGVYTTQTKISFTAVGDGMDNNSPKKGDTRYVPQSWTVINTNVWNSAPYTASFGLAQSGDYTLKVAFAQQQYDGSSWKATGTTDTRQVAFSITKAKVTAPGTNLTPAANRKNSVKTGDNTPILPFVCILIVAAGAIGGVVFYKKKNKK